MPSSYTTNLGIEKIATGEQSGSWGDTTNTNLDILDEAVNGVISVTLGATGSSGSPTALPITDGASSTGRNKFIEFVDGGDLGGTAFVQLTPNDSEKIVHIRNSLSASRSVIIFQGTYNASNDFEILNGTDVLLKFDGAGSGAVVTNVNINLNVNGLDVDGNVDVSGDLTLSAGADGALTFGAASSVKVVDNNAAALVFEEADTAYMTLVTTNGSEAVKFDKALDVNAAVQVDGIITVGVDGTGYDFLLFGDTGGKSLLWDQSADSLIVTGTTTLVGTTNLDTVDIDGNVQADGTITVGVDDTGYDVKFFGATSGKSMLWDESADSLIVNGTVDVTGTVTTDGLTVENNDALITLSGTRGTDTSHTVTTGGTNSQNLIIATGSTSGNGLYYRSGSHNFQSQDGTASHLTIDSSGDVSIPTGDLTIGSGQADGVILELSNTDSVSNGLQIQLSGNGKDVYFWNHENAAITFATNNEDRMTIDASGRLLVGTTTNYSAKLAVEGTKTLSSGIPNGQLSVVDDTALASGTGGAINFWGKYTTAGSYAEGASIEAYKSNSTSGNYQYGMWLKTRTHGGSMDDRLFMDQAQTVFNETGADTDFRVESDTITHALFVEGSSGNVGIGTNAPGKNLVIKAASVPTLKFNQASTYGAEIALRGNDLDIKGSANAIVFYTGGTNDVSTAEKMRISSGGDVLIGTTDTSPANNSANGTADNGTVIGGGLVMSAAYKSSANAGAVGYFNRTGTDGDIVQLFKSGVAVGGIGTNGSAPYLTTAVGSTLCGIKAQGGSTPRILPTDGDGAASNGVTDLGGSTERFKDLFIGNDIGHLDNGGTARLLYDRSANLLGNTGTNVTCATLSKSSGSFKIDHPLEAKTATHHLIHSFVESPTADNIYRGKIALVSGSATVNIDTVAGMTDGTFAALNREVQCFTSNESGWTAVKGSVSGNTLTITAQEDTCTDTVSWLVVGERQDPHMYATDWTDENGKVIVEPLKPVIEETEEETP